MLTKIYRIIAATASAVALLSAPASWAADAPSVLKSFGAFSHWYQDSAGLQPSGNGNESVWQDVIGEDTFDTKGIAARWEDGRLYLALVTNFPDANVTSAGRPVSPADLALDLDGDGVLETGIVLSNIRATGDRGITRAANIQRGMAYRVTKWLHPSDILKTTYGKGWRWSGPGGSEMQQSEIPVWVAEGEERHDLDVTVDWHALPGANGTTGRYAVLVSLAYHTDPRRLQNVPVVWGTAVCGNDVMFANTSRLRRPDMPLLVPSNAPNTPRVQTSGPRWNNGPWAGVPPIAASVPIVLTKSKNTDNSGSSPVGSGGFGGGGSSTGDNGSGTNNGGSGTNGNGSGGEKGGNAVDDLFGTGGGKGTGSGGSDSGDGYGTGDGTGSGGDGSEPGGGSGSGDVSGSGGGQGDGKGDAGSGTGGAGSSGTNGNETVTPVPVPPTVAMMGFALAVFGVAARRRRIQALRSDL